MPFRLQKFRMSCGRELQLLVGKDLTLGARLSVVEREELRETERISVSIFMCTTASCEVGPLSPRP